MQACDLPLAGVVVVEVSDNASLPFCGQVLAAMGAEVWKVERPGGDCTRGWGPSQWKGCGVAFHAVNRGKKSIRLDIKDPADLATLHALIVQKADVFMHNLRPGSAGKYGLDPDSLRARKPDLVCCELGAFGHAGPLNDRPGYDPLMQAFSGIMNVTGEEGRPPSRAGVPIADFGSALWSVIGIVSALFRRTRAGQGATVNTSLLETAVAWMGFSIANHAADGQEESRHGSGVAFVVPHRAYRAADGYLAVSAANEQLYARLCEAIDRPQWVRDPRFATNAERLRHRDAFDGLLEARLSEQPRAHWMARLDAAGIPNAPLQSVAELRAHPQIRALGILGKPSEDEVELVGLPLSFDRRRPPALHAAPALGQDDGALQAMLAAPVRT